MGTPNVEVTFSTLPDRFVEILQVRTWFGRFREVVLKTVVRNVELFVTGSDRGSPRTTGSCADGGENRSLGWFEFEFDDCWATS